MGARLIIMDLGPVLIGDLEVAGSNPAPGIYTPSSGAFSIPFALKSTCAESSVTADIYDVDRRLEVARARLGSLKYDHCN